MTSINLTREQEAFLEECNLEFSDRYTDADLDYKEIYDTGVPTPPIMYPWITRPNFNHRNRAGNSRNDYDRRDNFNDNRRGYEDYRRGYHEESHYMQRPNYRDDRRNRQYNPY